MFTGAKPYHAATARELLHMHINAKVPPLPATLARFQPVLEKMMAKNPAERFQSATELLDALDKVGP
jgi:serine/threonine-protein kinase PpkA